MTQRPSLLDDSDFASVGSSKKVSAGRDVDTAKLMKISLLVAVVALAALVYIVPLVRSGAPVVDGEGNPVVHRETEEDRQEFERQIQRLELEVEQGRASIDGA